jgi:transcriptional regulator with XRE-family HTH domain
MNYAKAIRIARSIAGISQARLATLSGVDRSYLSLIEGEKRKPTMETLQDISDSLKIPFHLLTLLATEKEDTKSISEEQVQSLAKQLTHLLLESPHDDDQLSLALDYADSRKSAQSGVSARGKKRRLA